MVKTSGDLDHIFDPTHRNRREDTRAGLPLTTLTQAVGSPTPNLTIARSDQGKVIPYRDVGDLTRCGHSDRARRILIGSVTELTKEAVTPASDLTLAIGNASVASSGGRLRYPSEPDH